MLRNTLSIYLRFEQPTHLSKYPTRWGESSSRTPLTSQPIHEVDEIASLNPRFDPTAVFAHSCAHGKHFWPSLPHHDMGRIAWRWRRRCGRWLPAEACVD